MKRAQWQNCEEKAAGCVSSTVLHSQDIIHSARPLPHHAFKIMANLLWNKMLNFLKNRSSSYKSDYRVDFLLSKEHNYIVSFYGLKEVAADDVQHTCFNFQVATLSLWVDKQPCNQCSPTLPAFQRSKLCEGAPLVILMEAIYLFKWRPSAVGEKLSDCSLKVSQPIWGCSLSHTANYHSDNESWSNITNLPMLVLKVTPAVYIR